MEETTLTVERLQRYFSISKKALQIAQRSSEDASLQGARADFLDMIQRYLSDAEHFRKEGRLVTAFAALNYAHGWLDAGARIGLWKVKDSSLFTVDEE